MAQLQAGGPEFKFPSIHIKSQIWRHVPAMSVLGVSEGEDRWSLELHGQLALLNQQASGSVRDPILNKQTKDQGNNWGRCSLLTSGLHIHIYTCMCTVHKNIHTWTCTHTGLHMCTHTCTETNMNIHTHMHIHTHTEAKHNLNCWKLNFWSFFLEFWSIWFW